MSGHAWKWRQLFVTQQASWVERRHMRRKTAEIPLRRDHQPLPGFVCAYAGHTPTARHWDVLQPNGKQHREGSSSVPPGYQKELTTR